MFLLLMNIEEIPTERFRGSHCIYEKRPAAQKPVSTTGAVLVFCFMRRTHGLYQSLCRSTEILRFLRLHALYGHIDLKSLLLRYSWTGHLTTHAPVHWSFRLFLELSTFDPQAMPVTVTQPWSWTWSGPFAYI